MKRKTLNIIFIVIVILFILAVVALYLYDVIWMKTHFTQNLFRTLSIVIILTLTLIRLIFGQGRKSLEIFERAYEKELGAAFQNAPFQRKKLLCACRLYNESNYSKALKYLFELLHKASSERDAGPVLFFIALCYTDAGFNNEAIEAYYRLLMIDANNAQVHSNLGILFVAEGDYEMALQHYNKSIEIEPKNYYAYVNRANYYFRIDEYDSAISDAKQALQYKNNGMEAASLLTIIYALKDDAKNKKHYYHISITSGKNPKELDNAIAFYLSEKDGRDEEQPDEEQPDGEPTGDLAEDMTEESPEE